MNRNRLAHISVFAYVLAFLALSLIGCDRIAQLRKSGAQVDLAKADHSTIMPDAGKEDALVFTVTRDGAVFLGQSKTPVDELGEQVKSRLGGNTNKTIYIRADSRAQYRVVEDAIDAMHTAGVYDVGFLTGKGEDEQRKNYFACSKPAVTPMGLEAVVPQPPKAGPPLLRRW